MTEWYYARNGQRFGPIPDSELQSAIHRGDLQPDDLVWTEDMAEWEPATILQGVTWPQGGMSVRPGPPAPPRGAPPRPRPPQHVPSHLGWSIAATLLCCLPTGIVAIVYSAKASTLQSSGQIPEAMQASESAKGWITISIVLGILAMLISLGINA